jgi:phosphoglycolate phosphatase
LNKIRLAVFDMAGTTVDDLVEGLPLVLKSYDDALRSQGISVPMEILNAQRGRDKWTVIKELGGEKAEEVYEVFISVLRKNINKVREVEGTSEVFKFLKQHGVSVVASTGFPAEIAEPMIDHLSWLKKSIIDGWVCSEQVGASRPDPAMIIHSMKKYNVPDPSSVMKIDDTVKGIEEGKNAGVYTIAVLTGTQSIQFLDASNPDTILRSVAKIPEHLLQKNLI